MIRRCIKSLAEMAMMTIPVSFQGPKTGITSSRGEGYTVWFLKDWKASVTESVFTLDTMSVSPCQFKIRPSRETSKDEFFAKYRQVASSVVGFPIRLASGTEPMLYGSWRGDSINGDGNLDGTDVIVSATAIDAHDRFNLLQMRAPLLFSWQGRQLREALARSLVFDCLPASDGSGAACRTGTQCPNVYNIGRSTYHYGHYPIGPTVIDHMPSYAIRRGP